MMEIRYAPLDTRPPPKKVERRVLAPKKEPEIVEGEEFEVSIPVLLLMLAVSVRIIMDMWTRTFSKK